MSAWGVIWTYWAILFVMTVVVTVKGSWPMRRTVWTIAFVCALQFVIGRWFLDPASKEHALAMIAVDTLACIMVTIPPVSTWQKAVGLTFILQIGGHFGRLAANNPDMSFYWWGLSVLAFVQLIFVGGWWAGERDLSRHRSDPDLLPAQARREGAG